MGGFNGILLRGYAEQNIDDADALPLDVFDSCVYTALLEILIGTQFCPSETTDNVGASALGSCGSVLSLTYAGSLPLCVCVCVCSYGVIPRPRPCVLCLVPRACAVETFGKPIANAEVLSLLLRLAPIASTWELKRDIMKVSGLQGPPCALDDFL